MTTKMTERDKRLLYILGIALFTLGFVYFLLIPAWDRCTASREQLDRAEELQTEMQAQIDRLDAARTDLTESQSAFINAALPLYNPMANDQIDALVTGLELKHGLLPVSLTMSEPDTTPLDAYIASTRRAVTDSALRMDDAAGGDADALPPGAAVLPDTAFIQTVTVSASVTGSQAQFMELVDDLNSNYPALHLAAFSGGGSYEAADGEAEQSSFSYTLAVFMCDKAGELN